MINIQTNSNKDILAKLMATENINVIHKTIPTAYFDVKSRTLACPILKDDMTPELYDLFMGHEVGHALNTPAEGWHDAVSDLGMTFKGYLNVIEDIRIEKKIKNTYPGLRKSFYTGYKELSDMDFFGLKERNQDVSELGFIDRINLHYKLGAQCRVEFSEEEMVYIKRCDSLETFEEVMDLAKELFENKEEETETMLDSLTPEELKALLEDLDLDDLEEDDSGTGETIKIEGEGKSDGESGSAESKEEDDSDGDEGESSDSDGESDKESNSAIGKEGSKSDEEKIADQLNKSETDESFRSKEGSLNKEKERYQRDPLFYDLPKKIKYENFIVGHKELNKVFTGSDIKKKYIRKYVKKFTDNNKKIVNYMVKEFEMKKAAAAYNRSYGAKSGELDMDKLAFYKLKDDIFNRVQVTPEGKNHGVVMAVDWSGSMSGSVKSTVEQALLLAMFCRRIQIPFRVFAFSDAYTRDESTTKINQIDDYDKRNEAFVKHGKEKLFGTDTKILEGFEDWGLGNLKLLEIVSDKMSNREFVEAMEDWLQTSFSIDNCYGHNDYGSDENWEYDHGAWEPSGLHLGGTPLDHTLIVMRDYLKDFKAKLGIDIMSFIALTDGQSHSVFDRDNSALVDRMTNKTIGGSYNSGRWTNLLLKWIKDTADVRTIGFYLTRSTGNSFLYDAAGFSGTEIPTWDERFDKKRKEFNKISTSFDDGNYDLSIIINQKKIDLNYSEDELDVSDNATKGQLKNALVKAGNNKMKQRVILNQFVQQMAV